MDLQKTPPPRLVPVEPQPGKPGRMTGALLVGWRDDLAWTEVAGGYALEEFERTRFLRVKIDQVNRGAAQLAAPFPGAKPGQAYEVRIGIRSPQKPVLFSVTIRQDGPPYSKYWREQTRTASDQFKKIVLQTTQLPEMQNPLFLLAFSMPGVVDGATWSAEVLKAGGLKWSNAASFHTYHADTNGFPGDIDSRAVNTP